MPRDFGRLFDNVPKTGAGIEVKDSYLDTKPVLKIFLFFLILLFVFAILVGVGYGAVYILLLLFPG
ncbi:MAG: hypothetical protein KJ847_04510 [Firmicutes bacterium]|nr:hypothetical protein [Bacillota bacterium]